MINLLGLLLSTIVGTHKVSDPTPESTMTPANTLTPLDLETLDFPFPTKVVTITAEMEAARYAIFRDQESFRSLLNFIGWSLEDQWNPSRTYNEKVWNKHCANIVSWLLVGAPLQAGPLTKYDMSDVLVWWSNAPEAVMDCIEPIITAWKIWAYNPDAGWVGHQYNAAQAIDYSGSQNPVLI